MNFNVNEIFENYCSNEYYETVSNLCNSGAKDVNGRFSVVSLNMRSMRSVEKFEELLGLVQKLKDVSIWAISETNIENCKDFYNIPGYNSVFCNRVGRSGGGAVLYIKVGIRFEVLRQEDDFFNCVGIRVTNEDPKLRTLDIYLIYRPPNTNVANFLDSFEEIVSSCNGKPALLVGDINFDLNKRQTDTNVMRYLNLLSSYGFYVTNDIVTREISGSLLDHVSSNFLNKCEVKNVTFGVSASDHNAILTSFLLGARSNRSTTVNRKIVDYTIMTEKLAENLIGLEALQLTDDPNLMMNSLTKVFQETINQCSTVRSFKTKGEGKICEYFTEEILSMIEEKDKIWKRLKQVRKRLQNRGFSRFEDDPCYSGIFDIYKTVSNRLWKLKIEEKRKFNENLFKNGGLNTWTKLHQAMGTKPKNTLISEIRDGSGKTWKN